MTSASSALQARLFIDGQWRDGGDAGDFPVLDPATGETIARFPAATASDCEAAVRAAERAFPAWSQTSPRERSELLYRAFHTLRAERETLAEIIVRENGKAWADALAEADYATEFLRWFAEEAVRIPGDFRLSPAGDKRIVVSRHAIGVALLITPWNFPAAMATRKLGPALAAGCTTVLKPARETPLTAAYIVGVLDRVGAPAGVVNLVTPVPTGPLVAGMIADPAVRKLSFTGSTEVGRELLHACADSIVDTSMELGGNAPVIVLPGADLDDAVSAALQAKMRNGGSACTAANRFYVHASLHDAFVRRMADELSAVRTGAGLERENQLGALVSEVERDKVAALVSTAVDEGARVVVGGAALPPGAFYAPTLLDGVTHGSTITRREIFGPVTAVVAYDDVDDAVRMANDTEFGLVAYVLGPEHDALRVALRLDTGMVAVNRGVLSDPAAPFGGTKESGIGREGGKWGMEEYTEIQQITWKA